MAVGFKTKAVKEAEAKALVEANNSPLEVGEEMVNVPPVVAETFDRLESLNNFIVSKDFTKLDDDSKQAILNDFAYITQIANIL